MVNVLVPARRFVDRSLLPMALAFTAHLAAQSNRGGISGTVFDATGAVVRGASVTITNLGTNQQVTRRTSGEGAYAVEELDPVFYSVAVEQSGFKKKIIDQVKVDTASITKVDVTLEPGAVETEVQVAAEAPVLNTETGTLSRTITERQIRKQ